MDDPARLLPPARHEPVLALAWVVWHARAAWAEGALVIFVLDAKAAGRLLRAGRLACPRCVSNDSG